MDRLYYTYLIIKESLDYIPAVEIKKLLEENYQIKVDIKTIYQAIRNINELSKYIYQKEIIKTKHRKGYSIDEEFFNDGQFQYLWDSVLFNNDLNEDEVNALLTKLQTLSSSKQLSRIQNQPRKNLLLNMTTVIKAIHEKKNIYFKYVSYEIKRNKFVEIAHNHGNHKENNEFYIISPYKLIQRDSKYYVLGYFNQRPDKLSIYRLDRMRLVRNHKSPFEEGEQFDLEQEVDHINMYVSGQKDTLEISFDEVVLREVIDKNKKNLDKIILLKKTLKIAIILL